MLLGEDGMTTKRDENSPPASFSCEEIIMATIDTEETIRELIEHDGYFMDDPRVYQIVEYTNFNGKKCWGVTWENEPVSRLQRYEIPSTYIIAPKVIWRANVSNMEIKRS